MSELNKALKKLKSRKSPGPDKLHNEMLTHLGPIGKQTLLRLMNLTLQTSEIPRAWKNAIITPILKKGKPPEDLSSYRPISLTSVLGKNSRENDKFKALLVARKVRNYKQEPSRLQGRAKNRGPAF